MNSSFLQSLAMAPWLSALRACECNHPESHHDAVGRCHSCGCCQFFPKQIMSAAAEGDEPLGGERAGEHAPSDSPITTPGADPESAHGRTRELAGQRYSAVFLDREGHA